MRTIVPFLLAAAWCAAQSVQLKDLEKQLESKPDNQAARVQILQLLTVPNAVEGLTFDRVAGMRRRQVLWLIEHHPEQRGNFLRAAQLIPPRGPWADPEGYAESVRMWKQAASGPHAPAQVIANAALYLKATDRALARALLDAAIADRPEDPALWRGVGMLDAAAVAGVNGPGERGQFGTDESLRESPEARRARAEIESAGNAFLLAGAAEMLAGNLIQNQFQLSLGGVDADSLAERWLRGALEIAPGSPALDEWKTQLAQVIRNGANRSEDPRERARLFSEAAGFAADRDRAGYWMDLAKAEFEAGDDAAASRDARRTLEAAASPDLIKRNRPLPAILFNRAFTVLGRIALAHGDAGEAKSRLRASLEFPEGQSGDGFRFNGPDMTLAQDLADAGERDAVIEYLEASRRFWLYDRGSIDRYIKLVKAGKKREAFASFSSSALDLVNRPAPSFRAHEAGGKQWSRASLAGQPAAVLFWNAACERCADQIAEFAKAVDGTDTRLLAVNIGDSDAAVQAFVEKHRVGATVLMADRAMAVAWHTETYPSVAFLDAKGRVAQFQAGAVANPKQTLEGSTRPRVASPMALEASPGSNGVKLSWRPAPGARSYVVEWEARDQTGWPSDRDGFLRVIPTLDTQVDLECSKTIRWRVFAVGFGASSEPTAWQQSGTLQ